MYGNWVSQFILSLGTVIIFNMPTLFEAVFCWAECRTLLLPAAKLTHDQMKSAGRQTIVLASSSSSDFSYDQPVLWECVFKDKMCLKSIWRRICKLQYCKPWQGLVELPTSQADPWWRGKVTSRETFGLANAHPLTCILLWTWNPMPLLYAGCGLVWNMIDIGSSKKFRISEILLHFTVLWVGRLGRGGGRGVALAHSGLGDTQPHRCFSNHFHSEQNTYIMCSETEILKEHMSEKWKGACFVLAAIGALYVALYLP